MRNVRYLAAHEELVIAVRPHWAVLARVLLETASAVVGVLAVSVFFAAKGIDAGFLVTLLWWAVLVLVIRMLWKFLDWHVTSLMITNTRLMRLSGIFYRTIQTIPLAKITDMSYDRDPLGRLLGYGDFKLETEGDHVSALEKIRHVPNPDRIYLRFCDAIFGASPAANTDG
jgi:membrane protein YdbS with pleckstrin-like domain